MPFVHSVCVYLFPFILCREKGHHLVNLFRPEFVKANPVPLSSDAFTAFGAADAVVHNAEVAQARDRLLTLVIPQFVEELMSGLLSLSTTYLIRDEFHKRGINMRYLARVRAALYADTSSEPKFARLRAVLLTEMMSRVIKQRLRYEQRQTKAKTVAEYKLATFFVFFFLLDVSSVSHPHVWFWLKRRQQIVKFFNLIFGSGNASEECWRSHLFYWCLEKYGRFGEVFTEEDRLKKLDMDLRVHVLVSRRS